VGGEGDRMSTPEYLKLRAALHQQLKQVAGIQKIFDHEPTAIQVSPALYSLLDRVEVGVQSQVEARRYFVIHRLCVKWQDNARAEEELSGLIDPILNALNTAAHTRLSGLIESGMVTTIQVETGYLPFAGTVYRIADTLCSVLVKGPYHRSAV
jgi:hypothetical protein